ncbi:unnamed protein product [Fraxinus pennsylvanica]|uniref:Uncharacterized protein n=1 Tax=Fraxinus pennsylvanica TaxID=56036 RepID=A0AAD2E1Z7_9LAMI|nr:unnamed protein product [Fraxinus pennsylvanica]
MHHLKKSLTRKADISTNNSDGENRLLKSQEATSSGSKVNEVSLLQSNRPMSSCSQKAKYSFICECFFMTAKPPTEIVPWVKQGDNPTFGFLMPDNHLYANFRYLVDHPELLNFDIDGNSQNEREKAGSEHNDLDRLGG